jgi:hypothetical protein
MFLNLLRSCAIQSFRWFFKYFLRHKNRDLATIKIIATNEIVDKIRMTWHCSEVLKSTVSWNFVLWRSYAIMINLTDRVSHFSGQGISQHTQCLLPIWTLPWRWKQYSQTCLSLILLRSLKMRYSATLSVSDMFCSDFLFCSLVLFCPRRLEMETILALTWHSVMLYSYMNDTKPF